MTPAGQPLVSELVATLNGRSDAQNLRILPRVCDLFFSGWEKFGDEHVSVFDDVIGTLIQNAPDETLAELSAKLAPVSKAPVNVVACLARHDDIAVSGPVLEKSTVLSDYTLAEIAETKSEKHRAAISARTQLSETVTDMLVKHSYATVACNLVANPNVRFSTIGFVRLINQAKSDKELAAAIASRKDVPSELEPFLELALAS